MRKTKRKQNKNRFWQLLNKWAIKWRTLLEDSSVSIYATSYTSHDVVSKLILRFLHDLCSTHSTHQPTHPYRLIRSCLCVRALAALSLSCRGVASDCEVSPNLRRMSRNDGFKTQPALLQKHQVDQLFLGYRWAGTVTQSAIVIVSVCAAWSEP